MTKKEKILHSYITNIIEDENPKNIFILTSQDVSKLIKRIEKLCVNGLSIGPNIEKLSDENFDLFIILDDICLLYTSPSPRDLLGSRMPSSA